MDKSSVDKVTDPVCKMTFLPEKAAAKIEYQNNIYYFCNVNCKKKFAENPEFYLKNDTPAVACCCCGEAFEDDDSIIVQRQKKLLRSFMIAALLTILIVICAQIDFLSVRIRDYMQLLLATAAVFFPGGFLLRKGVESLIKRQLNMFTLIALGVSAAYFYSVYACFFAETLPEQLLSSSGSAKLHFPAAGMITALVILGQYLEARASSGASRAIRSLMELIPPVARRIKKCCGTISEIPLDEVVKGDLLQILPHDKIPVDGVVVEGVGTVDESMLTGESLPVDKSSGSKLAAGTLNGNTILIMRTEAVGRDTLLSQIVELVKSARSTRLPIQKLADKVSAVFVPAVVAAAVLSLLYWGLAAGNWAMAWSNFIAVLLAACPCSLGLAAPLAVTVGIGTGARHGLLIKNPAALEDLRHADTLMLDKTGTLTENKLHVKTVLLADDITPQMFFPVLFSLESGSQHPIAQTVMAMDEFAFYSGKLPEVEDYTALPGQGVTAIVDDLKFYLGSPSFIRKENIDLQVFIDEHKLDAAELDQSVIVLAAPRKIWGMLILEDVLQADAPEIVAELKQRNLELVIISGDSPAAVKNCACQLGINEFYAGLSPQNKLEKIRSRQAFGRNVIMVGDGVNDAAALAAADVSVAMGSGADAALANADITLLGGSLGKLNKLLRLSCAVNRTIKENLILAFAYNIVLIPMAGGLFYHITQWQFSPALSSIAMSGSCLLVVFNALRLWKLDLRGDFKTKSKTTAL